MKSANNARLVMGFALLATLMSLVLAWFIFFEYKQTAEALTDLDERYERLEKKLEALESTKRP